VRHLRPNDDTVDRAGRDNVSARRVFRDAATGEYITKAEAEQRPAETVSETVVDDTANEYRPWNSRQVRIVPSSNEGPAVNIPGVPEHIEWTDVAAFLVSLGIDLNHITRDGVTVGWDNIACDVPALNANGKPYLDLNTGHVAVHRICIPVHHDE
jgi:hypothetical protein